MAYSDNTNKDVKQICAINRDTVHKICSGQVVLNLAITVKELVENAIDAGATNIEIRLKEYGSELVEVSDNGTGVEEKNLSALTLKHYTSKLREFSDLESVSTLGFRGEALSSLCALSNVSITTRHKTVDYGTKLEYDNNGQIKTQNICARQIGTTVCLTNLFSTLPVRHKEFIKNLKRDFTKMCQLLYSYCLISEGVRILCTNQNKKGTRTTIVATQNSKSVKENIICVFGIKQLESLIEIEMHAPNEKTLEDYGIKRFSEEEIPFNFQGYISKCTHGSGRSSSDRQFYYINSRPCEPSKIMKLVNEVYKYFNGSQYPFVFLNIKAVQSQLDVNITPDKRQILMQEEKLLLATLKTSLLEMFKEFPSTFKMQNLDLSIKPNRETENKNLSKSLKLWTKKNEKILEQPNRGVKRNTEAQKPKGVFGFIHDKRLKIDEDFLHNLSTDSGSENEDKQIERFVKESYNSSDSEPDLSVVSVTKTKQKLNKIMNSKYKPQFLDPKIKNTVKELKSESGYKITVEDHDVTLDSNKINNHNMKSNIDTHKNDQKYNLNSKTIIDNLNISKFTNQNVEYNSKSSFNTVIEVIDKHNEIIGSQTCKQTTTSNSSIKKSFVDVAIPDLQSILNKMHVSESEDSKSSTVKFRSEITNKEAEKELERHISKDMFSKMEIIGQFNKGFIITKFNTDIFIIDQHASDEIYNFETLQKTTIMQNQQLVIPKPLELTAANELLLIDNLEVFKKNGFAFSIDENAEPRHKVKLTAMPVSKNWEFGKEAIDELLFMLQEDSATENMRPSGIRAMFASRACRKSVMIGSSLSLSDMRRIVDHMGQINQPWNCPHGRPTMRHLINLDLIKDCDSDNEEEDE